jgi:hypothetical protein
MFDGDYWLVYGVPENGSTMILLAKSKSLCKIGKSTFNLYLNHYVVRHNNSATAGLSYYKEKE